jgi:AraC family transcriptional regulator
VKMKNPDLLQEHISYVNRVIDFVDDQLMTDLSLESIAAKVAVSPYYLHRIFTKITGDSLHQHIVKSRIQRALHDLVFSRSLSISDIAERCGFSSLSTFSRAFKHGMGLSPDRFRKQHMQTINSKICKIENKQWERYFIQYPYNGNQGGSGESKYQLRISVREMPAKEIYYIRHFGKRNYGKMDFDILRSFHRLSLLATKLDLWTSGTYLVGIPKYSLVSEPQMQIGFEACLALPRKIPVFGDIGHRSFVGGRYAVLHLEEPAEAIESLVQIMLNSWLPDSGYTYASRPTMFILYNSPALHPERRWIVDVCLPIE